MAASNKLRIAFPIDLHFFNITGVCSNHLIFTKRGINIYKKEITKRRIKTSKECSAHKAHKWRTFNALRRVPKMSFQFRNINVYIESTLLLSTKIF